MQKSFRFLLAAALIGLGVWGWLILFPSPEKVIRSRLTSLAKTASSEPSEGNIAMAYNLQKLPDYFTTDVELNIETRGYPSVVLNGRDELMQALMMSRSQRSSIKVEFLDINVKLGPDRQTAVANLTCKVTPSGDRDFVVQESNFYLRKVDGKWLIYRVESVKTLSLIGAERFVTL